MSIHINAKKGDIAETILLPGDPLRAKWIAENFLENHILYNEVRNMLGYTGTFRGKRVSVQGTGMGAASISIYLHELINDFGVKNLIRVGTAGSLQPHIHLRELVIAMGASNNSNLNALYFDWESFAPTASFDLMQKAVALAKSKKIKYHVGNVLSSDIFYHEKPDYHQKWTKYGVLCVEMETAALYTLAAKFKVNAIALLTISDSLITHQQTTATERETTFKDMVEVALGLV